MTLLTQLAALVAILGTGVVYGTDVFGVIVQRAALARVDDAALTAVMGNFHRYADRRMPIPGVIGLLFSAVATVLAVVTSHWPASVAAGIALIVLVVWLVLYARISAPINRVLTAAVDNHETPANARTLQHDWDHIIVLRASLQGAAILALGISLIFI